MRAVVFLGLALLAGCVATAPAVNYSQFENVPLYAVNKSDAPSPYNLDLYEAACIAGSPDSDNIKRPFCKCTRENVANYTTANELSSMFATARSGNHTLVLASHPKLGKIEALCALKSIRGDSNYIVPPTAPPPVSVAVSTTVPTTGAVGFDASKVPMLSDEYRKRLQTYYSLSAPKAVAIAPNGSFASKSGAATDAEAIRLAMERCEFNAHMRCILYALNDTVVYSPSVSH